VVSTVGLLLLVCSLPREATGVTPRLLAKSIARWVTSRIVRCQLLLRRVGRVVEAVEQPGVGEEAHVDDVDPDQAGVHHRVDRRLQEQEAAAQAAADVDQGHLRRHPGGAESVEGGRHQAGDVGAVPVIVGVGRVDAGRHLAGPVDQRDVGDEVAAQPAVEVGRDVRVDGVDAGVDDPHHHPAALVEPVGAARGRVDHPHVPLPVGEGLRTAGANLDKRKRMWKDMRTACRPAHGQELSHLGGTIRW
jgi:hypothetical protein